MKQAAVGNCW